MKTIVLLCLFLVVLTQDVSTKSKLLIGNSKIKVTSFPSENEINENRLRERNIEKEELISKFYKVKIGNKEIRTIKTLSRNEAQNYNFIEGDYEHNVEVDTSNLKIGNSNIKVNKFMSEEQIKSNGNKLNFLE